MLPDRMQYGSFAIDYNLFGGLFYIYIRKNSGQQTVTPCTKSSHIYWLTYYLHLLSCWRQSSWDCDCMAHQAENVYYSGHLQKKFTK